MAIDRNRKLQLIERMLGLKHKLKVNESGSVPQNHKELAQIMVANWELEDEIKAIEEYVAQIREENMRHKLWQITSHDTERKESTPVTPSKKKK